MKRANGLTIPAALIFLALGLSGCPQSSAVLDKTVAVSFDSKGGGSVASEKTLPGYPVDEPANLTNSTDGNLIFSGWYTEDTYQTRWDFDDPVAEDMTLYAKWNAADTLSFTAISSGAAWEVSKGTGTLDADLYIPAYYKGIPVTRTADYGFQACSGITKLRLPEGLTEVGYGSFWGCTSLTSAEIPESVTTIAEYAFYSCNSLGGTIEISKNVASIGYDAFWFSYPTAINVASDNANYSSLDGVLFNKEATTLIIYPCGKSNSAYTIPSTVTAINDSAFNYNQHINTVSVPSGVTSIGYCAFMNCYSFSYIFIPASVTSIGNYAFASDWSLTIHCQAASQPSGWESSWNQSNRPVTWGCTE
jgi:uncharacterized repeat protein (TIGR02543 family)